MKKEGQFILIMWTYPNLAVYDRLKQSEIMKDSLDTTFEIPKLVEFSPKHDSKFEKLKQELAPHAFPGLRVLCLTRWTVRALKIYSVVDNCTLFF